MVILAFAVIALVTFLMLMGNKIKSDKVFTMWLIFFTSSAGFFIVKTIAYVFYKLYYWGLG